jgi:DNA-directed RNA polymerase subunit RPC12/RpoP
MVTIKAGDWCYGFRCSNCGHQIAVWPDQSQGRDPIVFEGKTQLEIVCPQPACRSLNLYRPEQVQHFLALGEHEV